MLSETIENTARMASCPSFIRCSAPKCPLDGLRRYRVKLPEDPVCSLKRSKIRSLKILG